VDRLSVYLNDHLAGATLGVELARRAARENDGGELGAFLEGFAREVVEDRAVLLRLMRTLDVEPSVTKSGLAWALEKAGRLKLNGQLTGYSPLSRLVELEGLSLGVRGKQSLWEALAAAFGSDPRLAEFDFAALALRAAHQLDDLTEQRLAAAPEAVRG